MNAHGISINDVNGDGHDVPPFDIIVEYPNNQAAMAVAFIGSLYNEIAESDFDNTVKSFYSSLSDTNTIPIEGEVALSNGLSGSIGVTVSEPEELGEVSDEGKYLQALAFTKYLQDGGDKIKDAIIQYAATAGDYSLLAALAESEEGDEDGE
jgi:hypothetical protein